MLDSSEGRCWCWKPATSRACRIFPGFSDHLGTELWSEKYVFLTWLCLKLVSPLGYLAFSWPGRAVRGMWWEVRAGPSIPGWPRRRKPEKERFVLTQRKPFQKVPAAWPSRGVEQWERCVRTEAAVMETWARQPALEITVQNKGGMSMLERPVPPACRTDGPTHHCLGNSH